jgi:hypothetical protein
MKKLKVSASNNLSENLLLKLSLKIIELVNGGWWVVNRRYCVGSAHHLGFKQFLSCK